MIKKASILALIICLFLVILSPCLVQARGELAILDSSVEVEFPTKLSFNLSAQSDVNITDIRLNYVVNRVSFAEVTSEVYIEFVPETTVEASWSWDMRKTGGLPPGSSVVYWWRVEDDKGDQVETTPVQVQFDDTRYQWRPLAEGKVTIYWYEGSESFAQELMAIAQQVLARLAEDTGAHLETPVRMYIYASSRDLRGSMIFPQEWTGGRAFPREGTIAIGISPGNLDWGARAIAHELAHLVIHQMTLNPYNDLPTWLDEGLAMYAEGLPQPGLVSYLNEALAEDRLISVQSLSSPIPSDTEEALLSYSQSYSLVEFLISNYGQEKMLGLLNIFRQGNGYYDDALEKTYGFDMDGLDARWREYLLAQASRAQTIEEEGMLALVGIVLRAPATLVPQ